VKLNYRANITQSTGEDWEDVSLTLSTASPLLGSAVPKVQPWRIAVHRPIPIYRTFGATPCGALVPQAAAQAAPPSPPILNRRRTHTVSSYSVDEAIVFNEGPNIHVREGAISSTFAIEGLSTIPSDNSSHKVSIAVSAVLLSRAIILH
jgi:uncharacterized protein (TIGR02231 family)